MDVVSRYPGSFGEILQGRTENGDVLVSFPVNLYTEVKLFNNGENSYYHNNNLKKSWTFIKNILELWGISRCINDISFSIKSDIPVGKGMSSSTADLCGIYLCLTKMFHREYNENELVDECIKVEPTDSIIFDKMTLFDYRNGGYTCTLGDYMKFNILVFQGNKMVDTVEFNRINSCNTSYIGDLVPVLKEAVHEKNLYKLTYVSTESIVRNQRRLYYKLLKNIMSISQCTGGLGIIGAHSGNVLGIVYDDIEKLNFTKESIGDKYSALKIYSLKSLDKNEFYEKRRENFE